MSDATLPDGHIELVSLYEFEDTLNRLRDAIQAEGFLLLHEINTQQIVKSHGIEIDRVHQLLFFHPRYIQAIMDNNPRAIVEAPLKFVVMENPSQQVIMVRFTQPNTLFGRYTGLTSMGRELNQIVTNITQSILS